MNLILNDITEAERRIRVEQTKKIDTPMNDDDDDNDIIFFTGDDSDFSMYNTMIEMTANYSTLQSWNMVKNALEYAGPKIFVEEKAIILIHNANANFPNENDDITFTILSVVSICVNEILDNPYKTLVTDKIFLEFYQN